MALVLAFGVVRLISVLLSRVAARTGTGERARDGQQHEPERTMFPPATEIDIVTPLNGSRRVSIDSDRKRAFTACSSFDDRCSGHATQSYYVL